MGIISIPFTSSIKNSIFSFLNSTMADRFDLPETSLASDFPANHVKDASNVHFPAPGRLEEDLQVQGNTTDKKIARYARLLVAQAVFIIFNIVIFQFYLRFPTHEALLTFTFSFAIIGMAATWLMYSMIRNFSSNRIFIRLVFSTFFVSFWSGIIAANPLDPIPFDSALYITLGTLNQAGSFLSFSIILVLMVNDIFVESHSIGYRLLGAACIYLNLGVVFSFAYGLINLLLENAMGLNTPADFVAYIHCVNYSFYTLANVDPPYQAASGIIHAMGVIQSLLVNLYIVLLIGRLLSK